MICLPSLTRSCKTRYTHCIDCRTEQNHHEEDLYHPLTPSRKQSVGVRAFYILGVQASDLLKWRWSSHEGQFHDFHSPPKSPRTTIDIPFAWPRQVHWYSITNSILVVLFLSLLVVSILVRNLKRDIAGYYNAIAALADEEKDEDVDKTGWKLVHADVFRPPQNNPMFFCIFIGTGVQIFLATLVCICLSALLNPMVGMTLTGIVPFAAAYVEFFFIMTSLWMDQYSFFTSGSTAIYTFVYSIIWFCTLEASKMVMTYLLYFGYMFLFCFAMFLVTGTVGALSSLWFIRKIFATIKVD